MGTLSRLRSLQIYENIRTVSVIPKWYGAVPAKAVLYDLVEWLAQLPPSWPGLWKVLFTSGLAGELAELGNLPVPKCLDGSGPG